MRLNAYLARAGVSSRRKSGELIKAGRVTVNGKTGELNTRIKDGDTIFLDGRPLKLPQFRYILLNKPSKVLTTLQDPHGRRTVSGLIKVSERIVPVGRLDFDTTGALLLTNDGELAHKLMHPSFEVDKVYEAEVEGRITPEALSRLSAGVKLDDGITSPAKVKQMSADKLEITLHEGRNRQVKRMAETVGLKVKRLHRKAYADLALGNLAPGQWRDLTSGEVSKLKMLQ